MLGFVPLASAPLAAPDANQALIGVGITSGVPTVAASTISQVHTLAATGITSGVPTIATIPISQVSNLIPLNIVAGVPIVGDPSITQIHGITSDDIVAGAPIVGPARFRWMEQPVGATTWTEQQAA